MTHFGKKTKTPIDKRDSKVYTSRLGQRGNVMLDSKLLQAWYASVIMWEERETHETLLKTALTEYLGRIFEKSEQEYIDKFVQCHLSMSAESLEQQGKRILAAKHKKIAKGLESNKNNVVKRIWETVNDQKS